MKITNQYILSAFILFLAVAIGAFGAHALKDYLTLKYLTTFKTGSAYHFYHGLALLMMTLINDKYENFLIKTSYFFMLGILLFSFNCYLYAIMQIKAFALIVPLGGVSFMLGWAYMIYAFYKKGKK